MPDGDLLSRGANTDGFLAALVAGSSARDTLDMVTELLPDQWPVLIRECLWGTAVLAGPAVELDDTHAVFGSAVANAWGVPGPRVARAEMLRRFKRYGAHVVHLAAGPFAVLDLQNGSVTCALTGVVPLYSAVGERAAVGTHRGVVTRLANASIARVAPAGAEVFVHGATHNIANLTVAESIGSVDLVALGHEAAIHLAHCPIPASPALEPSLRTPQGFRLERRGGDLVASAQPDQVPFTLGSLDSLAATRAALNDLWWQCGLAGAALFVPILERPSLDTLMLNLGSATAGRP